MKKEFSIEEALKLVKGNPDTFMLQYVPDELKTPEICFSAVQSSDLALFHIPESMKSLELYIAAVQNDKRAIQHVPKELKKSIYDLCYSIQ